MHVESNDVYARTGPAANGQEKIVPVAAHLGRTRDKQPMQVSPGARVRSWV